ncbi:hypothetical protein CHS0354_012916, partial [Potamilus streckersoni]
GKLKSSNVSLDDILIRRRDVVENTIALYSKDGKLKPGVFVSTITDKLTTVDSTANELKSLNDEYNNHKAEFNKFYELQKSIVDKIDKQLLEFLGIPPVTNTPNIAEIKASMLEFATFQLRYEEHVKQFSTFRKNIIDKFLGGPLDKLDIKLPDIKNPSKKYQRLIGNWKQSTRILQRSKTIFRYLKK